MLSADTKKLENAYAVFNQEYFDNGLPVAMITIQSSRGAYGHCTTQKVWGFRRGALLRVKFGSRSTLSRPIEHVLATLMHEMVHIYCMENGIKDTSNAGRYHNKSFKAEAERRGLKISKAGYIGWSVTEPTEEFIQNIQDWGLDAACENYRLGGEPDSGSIGPSGSGNEPGQMGMNPLRKDRAVPENIYVLSVGIV